MTGTIKKYEKELVQLERHLAELREQHSFLEYQRKGLTKILIHPFELHRLIQEEERKNRILLKQ